MKDLGRVVRKGRIRVDARKAMAKLREHLLVDLHLYAVEVARAAVLAGATRIDVTYDADDVVLAFDGRPLEAASLPRLFEHLIGEAEGDAARHPRLLALAVNAALGLAPAWVTLTSADGGAAAQVTWSPALVAAIEREEKPLPDVETIALPDGMPATGTRFHLKRKVGWETVRRAAARNAPREVALLVDAWCWPRVPLFVNGEPASSAARPPAIARAAITLPGVARAHVEITTTFNVAPHVEFCEAGVLLARAGFAFGAHFPMSEHLGVAPPVRVVVDSDALPTNASRSAVREDAPLLGALKNAAAPALEDAITGLVAAAFARGAVPDGVTVETANKAALVDALGAFLCAAEASLVARVQLPQGLRAVLDLPLFHDGLGRPLTHAEIPRNDPLLVWKGDAPVPEEMAPWARHLVWQRGRVAERILTARKWLPSEQLTALAKSGTARRQKLLATPPGPAAVPENAYLARERFGFREGPFAGLEGEVAIAADGAAYVRNLGLRVFLEGRHFQAFPVPEDAVPLPCVIALSWPGHIGPTFAYEGVEATAGLRAALAFAVRQAVLLCDRLAAEQARGEQLPTPGRAPRVRPSQIAGSAGEGRGAFSSTAGAVPHMRDETKAIVDSHSGRRSFDDDEQPSIGAQDVFSSIPFTVAAAAVLRAALATAVIAPATMYSAQGFEMPALADLSGLLHAAIWPTTEGAFTSLQDLCEQAARTGAICVAAAGTQGSAADGRAVVSLPSAEIEWLSLCLRTEIAIVHYDAALVASASALRARTRTQITTFADLVAETSLAPILYVEAKGHTFAVTIGTSETRVWHAGVELSCTALDDSLGGVTIAIDDDSIVPSPDWKTVAYAADQAIAARAERAFAERLVSALLGDPSAREKLAARLGASGTPRWGWPDDLTALPHSVQRYLVDRAARGRADGATAEDRALGARIELLPILTMLRERGEPTSASLADVLATYPDRLPIPYLHVPPSFRPIGWKPLVSADDGVLGALARWSGGRLQDARIELFEQERRAMQEDQINGFRAQPKLDPSVVGPRGDASGPVVYLPAIARHGVYGVAAALPIPDGALGIALAEFLFEDRLLFERPLSGAPFPIIARVSLLDRAALVGTSDLTMMGEDASTARVSAAAAALALEILDRARTPGNARPTFFRDVRALRLVLALVSQPQRDARIENALRNPELKWPTVQGDERSFADLYYVDRTLWAGAATYASWLAPPGAPTDLDRPILHLPPTSEGALLGTILERIGVQVRTVTDEIAALQRKRSQGSSDKPRLAARPVHPRLAQDFAALQLAGVDGEIALYEDGESVVEVTALNGDTRRIPLDLGFPARAVARVEVLTPSAVPVLAEKLTRAAVRLLLGLIPELDGLPSFVRAHLRALTCRALAKDRKAPPAVCSAPLFQDVDAAWWSLDDILSGKLGDLSCTFDPPPYAKARQDGRTLCLSRAEHIQLVRKVKILNVTEWMRRDLESERRRAAEPIARIRFDDEARAHMFAWTEVSESSLEGEIGLLAPASAAAHSIQVLTTRRPLCKIDDSPGWPIAAVVNDDGLHPTRWFDSVLPTEEIALRSRVRAIATRALRDVLAKDLPPERQRLATVFIDEPVPPVAAYGSTEPMIVTGHVYLPARWPTAPTARVLVQGLDDLPQAPISLASAPIQPWLPIGGAIAVSHGAPDFTRGAACRVALGLRGGVERMLASLLHDRPDDPELLAYQWNLRLLGATFSSEPAATSADGAPIRIDDLIALLHGGGDVWLTDRGGTIEGAFPEGAVPFVLLDDGSPLLRVLRARVPADRFKRLGGAPASKGSAPVSKPAQALAPPSHPPPPGGESVPFNAADASHRTSRSWLSAVLGRVTDLLAGTRPEGTAPTAIVAAVERALRAMRLREEPVVVVLEATRGKLVRYDERRRAVLINVAHPAVAPHVASPSPSAMRRLCIALVAAALSEVNIALEHVTDHDEGQALLELLRQEAAAAEQKG